MGSYRLNDAALADLDRIYEYGILTFGLQQADKYYDPRNGRWTCIKSASN